MCPVLILLKSAFFLSSAAPPALFFELASATARSYCEAGSIQNSGTPPGYRKNNPGFQHSAPAVAVSQTLERLFNNLLICQAQISHRYVPAHRNQSFLPEETAIRGAAWKPDDVIIPRQSVLYPLFCLCFCCLYYRSCPFFLFVSIVSFISGIPSSTHNSNTVPIRSRYALVPG